MNRTFLPDRAHLALALAIVKDKPPETELKGQ
jgi:hypothetical protein